MNLIPIFIFGLFLSVSPNFDDLCDKVLSYLPSIVNKVSYMCPDFSSTTDKMQQSKFPDLKPNQYKTTLPDGRPIHLFGYLKIKCLALGEYYTLNDPDVEIASHNQEKSTKSNRSLSNIQKDVQVSFINTKGETEVLTGKAKLAICTIYDADNLNSTFNNVIEKNVLRLHQEYKGHSIYAFQPKDELPFFYSQASDNILLEANGIFGIKAMIDTYFGDTPAFIDEKEYEQLTEILKDINVSTSLGRQWKYHDPNKEKKLQLALLIKLGAPLEAQLAHEDNANIHPILITSQASIIEKDSFQSVSKSYYIYNDEQKAKESYQTLKESIDQKDKSSGNVYITSDGRKVKTGGNQDSRSVVSIKGNIVILEKITKRGKAILSQK